MNNYRLNRTAMMLVALLVVVALGVFGYTFFVQQGSEEVYVSEGTTAPAADEQEAVELVTAKYQYRDGIHTIAGTIDLPTPCHLLEVEPFFVGEDRMNVELRFTRSLAQNTDCVQVTTPQPFKVTFEAPEGVNISATLNGVPVTLNIVTVPEGEDLDNFDAFIKG